MYLRQASRLTRPENSSTTMPGLQTGLKRAGKETSPAGGGSAESLQPLETWLRLEQQRRQLAGEAGRIDQVTEWGEGCFQYRYNRQGDLTELIEANGQQVFYLYDDQRRLVKVCHADGAATTYSYGQDDRLCRVNDRGLISQFSHDLQGRLAKAQYGQSHVAVYRYDGQGRVSLARTSEVTTTWQYDEQGRVVATGQTIAGITIELQLRYDEDGRLAEMILPGSACPIRYRWDERGRPQLVALGEVWLARFSYRDDLKATHIQLKNGLEVETAANRQDSRPVSQIVRRGDQTLSRRMITYNAVGEILADGRYCYRYDTLGRLTGAKEVEARNPFFLHRTYSAKKRVSEGTDGQIGQFALQVPPRQEWGFSYDKMDNRTGHSDVTGIYHYQYDRHNRLIALQAETGEISQLSYDRWGRLTGRHDPAGGWSYLYDEAGQLRQVRRQGDVVASFSYDHKGRLVLANFGDRVERYLYGPADELLAITDQYGRPVRLMIRTPLGLLAEVHGPLGVGEVYYRHDDERGSTHFITGPAGEIVASFDLSPFGLPLPDKDEYFPYSLGKLGVDCQIHALAAGFGNPGGVEPGQVGNTPQFRPMFGGRLWYPEINLYYFGARWYSPDLGRFLTPDSYTGGPDDQRLVNPLAPAGGQAAARAQILNEWLKQPRVRHRYVFCRNEPIGHVDPTGHWSVGGVLLTLLGVIWTLPNTLFGLLIEITCLIGEVIRWLVWLVSIGNVTWETPGFDAAASGRLNAFALVFSGGWFGSFSGLLGITFGNVFFVYKNWQENPEVGGPGDVFPEAYGGRVAIPRREALYEHELRHTNQYGWFGPFYHLGLPIFGVYLWDLIFSGSYCDMWLERDARQHAGI